MKRLPLQFALSFIAMIGLLDPLIAQQTTIDQKVDSVLKLMTLDEKIGQLNQYTSSWSTGPVSPEGNKLQEIKEGKIGSLLNVKGVEKTGSMQQVAMQSRLKIPLLFGLDVIHGYKTTFPIPLAEAASWDLMQLNYRQELQQQKHRHQAFTGRLHQWLILPVILVGEG